VHLLGVGQLGKARELTSIARATEPLNRTVRGFNMLALALSGDGAAADRDRYHRTEPPHKPSTRSPTRAARLAGSHKTSHTYHPRLVDGYACMLMSYDS